MSQSLLLPHTPTRDAKCRCCKLPIYRDIPAYRVNIKMGSTKVVFLVCKPCVRFTMSFLSSETIL